ncbi:colicin E3/pyocin S6 family cytotoxin [Pandoraea terrae]|uniref:colicin E3/pyocin S6 family cytotoxin n=1 Tax=Pandoraea terrae TaxID=1537710 RepID=UPI001CD5EE63|nr:colicin E3/pyocin S6 family cytotoxin [Pandoraea terrae]
MIEIAAFPYLVKTKPKTPVQGGGGLMARWCDMKGRIYEWDFQHGAIEKYTSRGQHLGEFDHLTGERLKPADRNRWIEP